MNRLFGASVGARFGIATAGKPYYDLMQALRDLGIGRSELNVLGVRVAKFGMTFPLEPRFVAEFASGLETILVIEEKRSFLELQLREALYNLAERPTIIGKNDAHGQVLLPATGELDPEQIASVLARHLPPHESFAQRLNQIREAATRHRERSVLSRPSSVPAAHITGLPCCSKARLRPAVSDVTGCPPLKANRDVAMLFSLTWAEKVHLGSVWRRSSSENTSSRILVTAPIFTPGSLAMEAAIAAGVNITYKILYNGAVAMTGGQQPSGALPVPALTRKLEADGVRKQPFLQMKSKNTPVSRSLPTLSYAIAMPSLKSCASWNSSRE